MLKQQFESFREDQHLRISSHLVHALEAQRTPQLLLLGQVVEAPVEPANPSQHIFLVQVGNDVYGDIRWHLRQTTGEASKGVDHLLELQFNFVSFHVGEKLFNLQGRLFLSDDHRV